jgi:CDP-glycerol glycerophosphotransferase (TagB/SpsB family)
MSRSAPLIRSVHRLRNVKRAGRAAAALMFSALSALIPRDPRLWVFGNRNSFGDNSRYLMEYVASNHPTIRAVWLGSDDLAVQRARDAGFEAHRGGSLRGISLAFRAGVGIVSQGVSDLNRAALSGMTVVNLYHGTAFKKIGLDSPVTWAVVPGSPTRLLNRAVRWLFRLWMRQIDLLPAPSCVVARHLESAFGLPPERIPVTGTPRTDVILESRDRGCGAGDAFKRRTGIDPTDRLVLYAPTWREYKAAGDLLAGFDREAWTRTLEEHDAWLLFRFHPNMAIPAERMEEYTSARSRWLAPDAWQDVNRLLCAIDVLVTDYSSIVFDYAVLHRPIVFFAPDLSDFAAARSFYEPYEQVTGGRHHLEWDDVRRDVAASLASGQGGQAAIARAIAARYNAFLDTSNRERIVQVILAGSRR